MYDITLTYNTACCLGGREQCVLALRSPLCSEKMCVPSRPVVKTKKYRPVPSKKKGTAPSRRGRNYIPSGPVVKKYMHRLIPSSKNIYILRSIPSRPVVTIFAYRPVPSWNKKVIVLLYRRENSDTPSRPTQATIIFIILPSRLQFFSRQTCQSSTVPSRLEYSQPWKSLDSFDGWRMEQWLNWYFEVWYYRSSPLCL